MQEHPYLTRDDFPSYNDEFAKLYQQLHPDKVPETRIPSVKVLPSA